MQPTHMEVIATVIFAVAVIHTFFVSKFHHIALKYPAGSVANEIWLFFGEVEAVFGMWSAVFIALYIHDQGLAVYDENHKVIGGAVHYLENLNFTEPAFVFVIMCMAGSRPVIVLAEKLIMLFSKLMGVFPQRMAYYCSALILGPILGSFITEPAAMTVTALILLDYFYSNPKMSDKFKYATIGLLFVNISIGGTFTHFAAPPVLMVASKWKWDMAFMMTHYGWKSGFAIILSTLMTAFYFKKELQGQLEVKPKSKNYMAPTWWITLASVLFLGSVVFMAHHMVIFLGIFLFFLGFSIVTKEYQDKLKLKESLMVGFFLAGLVTLGSLQSWWLTPLLNRMGETAIFFGCTALTAITDNAALTYLGSLVPDLSDAKKFYLVAGAVAGGGLTVIANAPNPAGFGILKGKFGPDGINPMKLLLGALIPTIIAIISLEFFPNI
ncbi:MAG: putative Na+/H+ antiporter [Bacteriovoracales bacterium]